MARQPDAPAGRQRLVAVVAVAGLVAATAIAFGRVFVGHAPTRELVLAAAASVALAAALERRSLALSLLVSAAGLALAIAWIVLPQTTWYGVPTIHTLRAVGRSLDFVAQQARVQVAPTPAFAPLMLAAVTATWTAAFSTYALAIRAGSPLLAVVPCVALVAFADTVLEDGARPAYAILFLIAVLGVVFVDGVRRVREWGPVWSSPRGGRGFARAASRGAQTVAVAAVLAAVLAPGVLPGFRASALVDFSTSGDDGIDLDPFVSIQNQLQEQDPVDLFDVTAAGEGSYWRLYSLDTFDGTTWSSTDPQAAKGQPLETPAQLQSTFPPTAAPLAQQVRVLTDINDPWLPMAFPPETLTVPSSDTLRYDADLGTAVLSGGLDAGLEYTVRSRVVDPTPEELNLFRYGDAPTDSRYTDLPDGLDPRLAEVAKRWAEGATTPYEQVMAIQDHFRDGSYEYDTDVQPVADADALLNFIANTKKGFCQQYATAMAVLVRELGYPARVAVGFRQGTHAGDRFTVTSKDAHAWVEVYFGPMYGWLPFEPTPTKTNPLAQPGTYLNPTTTPDGSTVGNRNNPEDVPGAGRGTNAECTEGASEIGVLRQLCNADHQLSRRGRSAGGGDLPPGFFPAVAAPQDPTGYSIPYRWIGLALAAMILLVLLITPIAKWIWRRRTLRRSHGPRELVLAAYRVFDGEAADLGLGRRTGETLEEHRARLAAASALSDGHLARLTALASRAAYSSEAPTGEEARGAVRDARTAAADLRKDAPFVRRVLGTYRPGV